MMSTIPPLLLNLTEDKLLTELRDQDIQISNIGSCCLHKVHNAFRNPLRQIDCDFDQFAIDLHSFFKLSSARRGDYLSMEEVCVCLKVNFSLWRCYFSFSNKPYPKLLSLLHILIM